MGKRLAGALLSAALFVPALSAVMAAPAVAASTPRLTVGDVRVDEGDAGKVVVKVPIALDAPAPSAVSIAWKVTGGSATPRVDFLAPKNGVRVGRSTIKATKTEATVSVTVYGDTTVEPDETVFVDVTAATGAQVTRSRGTVTITNDDGTTNGARATRRSNAAADVAPAPRVSLGVPTITEGNTGVRDALVPISLSTPAVALTTVTFSTPGTEVTDPEGNGDCSSSDESTVGAMTKTITFKVGQQSTAVKVPVTGNVDDDPTRDVVDSITVNGVGVTVAQPTADVVVLDDDGAPVADPPPVGPMRVSEPANGSDPTFPSNVSHRVACAYPTSDHPRISADGRYVVFESNADNLVENDTNGYTDVFEKDLWTGTVTRISVAADGTQADNVSMALGVSADGQDVLFVSWADNLVPGDDNHGLDLFVADATAGTVERVGALHGSFFSEDGSMSSDGRYVAFETSAPLTGGCTCPTIMVLDRTTNSYTVASTGPSGVLTWPGHPTISGDGRHVAFIAADGANTYEVYEKDLDTGTLRIASVNDAGDDLTGETGVSPMQPSISDDGRYVTFDAQACNAGVPSSICGDGSLGRIDEAYVRDVVAGTTTVASLTSDGQPVLGGSDYVAMSGNGRYVLFETADVATAADCAQTGPDAGGTHLYLRDLVSGTTERVDALPGVSCPSVEMNNYASQALSDDGSMVVYSALPDYDLPVGETNPVTVYANRLW